MVRASGSTAIRTLHQHEPVFDADRNQVLLLRDAMPPESWPEMPKQQVAQQLVARLIDAQ